MYISINTLIYQSIFYLFISVHNFHILFPICVLPQNIVKFFLPQNVIYEVPWTSWIADLRQVLRVDTPCDWVVTPCEENLNVWIGGMYPEHRPTIALPSETSDSSLSGGLEGFMVWVHESICNVRLLFLSHSLLLFLSPSLLFSLPPFFSSFLA